MMKKIAYLAGFLALIAAVPLACNGCSSVQDPNQEALSQLTGLAVVHADETEALTRWEAGYTLRSQDVAEIQAIAEDAKAMAQTAVNLYKPYREKKVNEQ